MTHESAMAVVCGIGASALCLSAFACDLPDVNLKLKDVKSIDVSGSVDADYPEIALADSDLATPFRDVLAKRGVTDDLSSANILDIELQIDKQNVGNAPVYAVILSFEYTEPCTAKRIDLYRACAIWEDHEPLKMFTDPAAIKKYVTETVDVQVKSFINLVDHQVDCAGRPFPPSDR